MILSKKIFIIMGCAILATLPLITLAAPAACPELSAVTAANAGRWFECLIERILTIIVWPIFIAVGIIMFIWAGILFISAQGDPGKVGDARKAFIWAVVGITIGLLGYSAVGIIRGALNL